MTEAVLSKVRKGARCIQDIPPHILTALNRGEIETANLMECLAIDFVSLMRAAVPDLKKSALSAMQQSTDGWLGKTRLACKIMHDHGGKQIIPHLLNHTSDSVRGWAAGVISHLPELAIHERLELIKPLADDSHFGVREVAWLLLRPHIATDIHQGIQIFEKWVTHISPNMRRYATESTRPRGVWCAHIQVLKDNPEAAVPLLEPLKSDGSRYVQDSVGNWLNDASKTQPDWVKKLADRWLAESPTKETVYICKKALRTLTKKA